MSVLPGAKPFGREPQNGPRERQRGSGIRGIERRATAHHLAAHSGADAKAVSRWPFCGVGGNKCAARKNRRAEESKTAPPEIQNRTGKA
jgi:hypothetical protein